METEDREDSAGFFSMLLHETAAMWGSICTKIPAFFRNSQLYSLFLTKNAKPPAAKQNITIPAAEDDVELHSEPMQQPELFQQEQPRVNRMEKLLDRFSSKIHSREDRKKLAAQKNAQKKNKLTSDSQLEIEFKEAVAEAEAPLELRPLEKELPEYQLPPLDIFNAGHAEPVVDMEEIRENSAKIQECLDNFNLDADVGAAIRGPRVTLFQILVAKGVRVSNVASYGKDLAMALAAETLRIIAPVPGHEYMGVEVPNKHADKVLCGDILNGKEWSETRASLPLIMGRNIEGKDVIMDLAKAPHLLVAGATGSGKSVCLNSFIVSMAARFSPDDLKLVLVDPKVVEMNIYHTLPHLIVPVINDVQLVVIALRWLIWEMGRRYKILSQVKVRDLKSFNSRPPDAAVILDEEGNPIPQKMPFIVLVIDELADIMLSNKNEIENSLARLAQMSRAVGIHTIVATQRPSVDVITGVIKANFPTRIAFKTSSQVDSRTIIDGKGAESLLGSGDMLYRPPTASGLERIQGAMVTDREIQELVDFCAAQRPAPDSFELIKAPVETENTDTPEEDADSGDRSNLLRAAMEIIITGNKASISFIQRKLNIGYNKAATLMEQLEQKGYVGPQIPGAQKREILLDSMEDFQD